MSFSVGQTVFLKSGSPPLKVLEIIGEDVRVQWLHGALEFRQSLPAACLTAQPPRSEVYAVIDGERAYQDKRWTKETTTSEGMHSVDEWVLFIDDYVREAKTQLARNGRPAASNMALHTIRKITAMGVACMEQNGAPRREGY